MKKLFDKVGKKRDSHSLVGKVVLVGQYSVKVEALIGEGGFATIYKCVDIKSGNTFALKHMRLGGDSEAIREVQKEAKTMARLKGHPNILKLHAVAFAGPAGGETDGFMLLDYCPQTLLDVMQRSNFNLDDYLIYEVFQDVVWAVAHMHKCNPPLAHRDLKAENVLKNGEGRWVICDFGSSTARAQVYDTPAEIALEEENIRRTTTPAYRAPEMWDLYARQRIDTAVDVWALGVLLYVLAFGKLPFQGDSKLSILYGKYDTPPGRPAAMRSLIQDMLQVNPKDRPDIFQVISKLDILRNALSGDPIDAPPPPLPSPPTPLAQAPAAAPPHQHLQHPPQTHSGPPPHVHVHPQQLPQCGSGAVAVGSATLYPPQHATAAPPQGPLHGLPAPQQHRTESPTPNGQPMAWTHGPAVQGYNSAQLPAHMQLPQQPPQPQSQVVPSQAPPTQPSHHQPRPSLYASPQHGSQQKPPQQYPSHLQPGQPQAYGPSPGALHPHPGPGLGPGSATGPAGGTSVGKPKSGAGMLPVQRVPSRQGSFNPDWPTPESAPQPPLQNLHPHGPQQPSTAPATAAGAAAAVSAPPLVNLMDAAMQEPAATANAAAGPDWEWDFQGRSSGRNGSELISAWQLDVVAGGSSSSPSSAAYARPTRAQLHRRTGSNTESTRLPSPGPVLSAAPSALHANMGFGDDNVDWGEQPGLGGVPGQQQPRPPQQPGCQSDLPPLRVENLASSIGGGSADGSGAAGEGSLATSVVMPPALRPAGLLHSTANSVSSQCSPLAATAVAATALLSAAERPSPVAALTAAAQPHGPTSSGALARQAVVGTPDNASTDIAASSGTSAMQRVGSYELVGGGTMELESLRAQLQHVTAANSQLEGRVQQLEGTVAAQAAILQRLASELRVLIVRQQQQQQQQQAHLPLQQQQSHKQPSSQQVVAVAHQTPAVISCNSSGGGSGSASTAPVRIVQPGSIPKSISMDVSGVLPGIGGDGGGTASADSSAGGVGGSGGGGGGVIAVPESPARPGALLGFEPEPWSSPGAAPIYPPLRYEDLA